ncbi:MAG: CusA/CzcA family heavy metal efflux RND transporter [Muribaculaceae bacterium]|nr:CusA/CzcA family heavy metal efflux RND transporter [Muribaculaceae bacterium]
MLDKIIRFSLGNRLLILAAALLIIVCGIFVVRKMDVDIFPDLNAPTVTVMTEAPGMAAEEVEQLVTFPIETSMNGATGVRRVRSTSTNGFSAVWVEFDWGTDIYRARQTVSEKLAESGRELPAGSGQPVMGPQSSILGEMLIVGLTADSTSMLDLRTLAERTIRPRLLSVGGVSQVSVLGGDMKEFQILLHPEKMAHYGVTLSEVLAATRGMNSNSNGGTVYEYGNEYIVRGMLSTTDTERLGASVVKRAESGYPVTLADIADVTVGGKTPKTGTASEKGKSAVLLTVTKQPGAGTIGLTEKIDKTLEELKPSLPADVNISTDIFRQADFIENAIDNVKSSLLEGAFFVVIILFLFLANVRTTLISLVTIPVAFIVTVLVLYGMGYTINTMSLGGLAIAIGSLVDDAIVDVENVWKKLRENRNLTADKRRKIAEIVFEASSEVRTPILNSTLIIVMSFVPLFFLQGMEGRMLAPLGLAFITALFASTAVALTLTPVLCSYLLTDKALARRELKEPRLTRKLKGWYGKTLDTALRHKKAVVGVTATILVITLGLFFTLGHSFLPGFNEGSLTINVSSMPGISLEESDNIGRRAEMILLDVPEIRTVARKTGRAELDEHALGVNVSEIEAPFELGERSHEEFMEDVRKRLAEIPGANIEIGQPISHRIDAMLSGSRASIAIKLFGTDLNRMYRLGNEIKEAIEDVEGIADLNVEQQIERPEIQIIPRREVLARHGITLAEFSEMTGVLLGGESVSQIYEGNQSYDLTVKVDDAHRLGIDDIRGLLIDLPDGGKIPLEAVADVVSKSGPNSISRENVKRKLVISANSTGGDLRGTVNQIRERIAERVVLPEGYHLEYGGQFESEQAASNMLLWTSLGSIVLIFLLLYMEFKNLLESAIILLNLPFALIGGVIVLLCTSGEVSIPAIIGFISLFGIATRNGMLLIARYDFLRERGTGLTEAVRLGSLDRMNPILMTALTSALALIPLAARGDLPGNEIQSPMAAVILGGLISSTFLNFYIIPIVYIEITKFQHRKSSKNRTDDQTAL